MKFNPCTYLPKGSWNISRKIQSIDKKKVLNAPVYIIYLSYTWLIVNAFFHQTTIIGNRYV